MFENLKNANRLLMEAELIPVQGSRFQPTGFPDIGAATYQLPDETWMLLVESAQSVANRLEATIIGTDNDLIKELSGLPYIRVNMNGDSSAKTNSLMEAHRINSPFIISDPAFQESFVKMADYAKAKPLDWQKIAKAVFHYDPNAVLHGVFLANLGDGRIKMSRAITGFIEAKGIKEVVSGGVKNNPIDPTGKLRAKAYDKDVYGNVPYQRVEYTAEQIKAYFNLDIGLLRSYALGDHAFDLLVGLALFKIRRFLKNGARLRTACDFKVNGELICTEPTGFKVPTEGTLIEKLTADIKACQDLFAKPSITEISTNVVWKVKEDKREKSSKEEIPSNESTGD